MLLALLFLQDVQAASAGTLASAIIPAEIPDNGRFPAFNMSQRLNNLNLGVPIG